VSASSLAVDVFAYRAQNLVACHRYNVGAFLLFKFGGSVCLAVMSVCEVNEDELFMMEKISRGLSVCFVAESHLYTK
jgi:hypothetical protein